MPNIAGLSRTIDCMPPRTFALIPAAGKSRRMGQAKLLLPLGKSTVLEAVLQAVRAAGIADILVVVAPDADELAELAAKAGTHVLRLDHDTPDMRSTCEHGLAWIGEHLHPNPDDGWLLLPADHPTLRAEVIQALLLATANILGKTIIVPTFEGRRGHPTWLRWSHAAKIQALPLESGLNAYIRSYSTETIELPWPSAEILCDLDTPADYQRLTGGDAP